MQSQLFNVVLAALAMSSSVAAKKFHLGERAHGHIFAGNYGRGYGRSYGGYNVTTTTNGTTTTTSSSTAITTNLPTTTATTTGTNSLTTTGSATGTNSLTSTDSLTTTAKATTTESLTTSTIYTTTTHTVTKCPAYVTNCPYVVTETIPIYTTVCPVGSNPQPPATITSTYYTTYTISGSTTTECLTTTWYPQQTSPASVPAQPTTYLQETTTVYAEVTVPAGGEGSGSSPSGPAPAGPAPSISYKTIPVQPQPSGYIPVPPPQGGNGTAVPTPGGPVQAAGAKFGVSALALVGAVVVFAL